MTPRKKGRRLQNLRVNTIVGISLLPSLPFFSEIINPVVDCRNLFLEFIGKFNKPLLIVVVIFHFQNIYSSKAPQYVALNDNYMDMRPSQTVQPDSLQGKYTHL